MEKEKLTLDAIKMDLMKVADDQISNKADWRFSYIIPITLLAILIAVFFKNIFVGLLIFSFAVYHMVRYVMEYQKYKAKKTAILSLIKCGEISILTETLSHIANDTVYEPHQAGRKMRTIKTVTFYHFNGGRCWRLPLFSKHYAWSRDFYVSSEGLENISIPGDEFFFVSLQEHPDIAYVYPCKSFILDGNLKPQD